MDELRIAVLNKTAFVDMAPEIFPGAKIVMIDSVWDFFDGDKADALLTSAEEGYAMTLVHPYYNMALFEPKDSYRVLYAYPVSKNSSETFLLLLNYWILGRIPKENEPH